MIAHQSSERRTQANPAERERAERARADAGRQEPFSAQGGGEAEDGARPHPLSALFRDLAALQGYLAHYLAARSDAVLASVRRAIAWTAVGLVGAIVGIALLVSASVLLLNGLADGLTVLFGGRVWAGELVTGLLVLGLAAMVVYLGVRFWLNSSTRKIKEKYERRRSQERNAFGRDVTQRAAERSPATR